MAMELVTLLLGYPQTRIHRSSQARSECLGMHKEIMLFCSKPHSPESAPRSTDAQPHSWQSTWVESIIKQKTRDPYFTVPTTALQNCFALR